MKTSGFLVVLGLSLGAACTMPSQEKTAGRSIPGTDGVTRLRLSLRGDDGQLLATLYNEKLEALGLETFPEYVDVGPADGQLYWKYNELMDKLTEADPTISDSLAGTGTPGEYDGICFLGDPLAVADVARSLTDGWFSEQLGIGGWRYGSTKTSDYEGEDGWEDYFDDVWKNWDRTSSAVLLETTASDGGDDLSADIIPGCGEPITCETIEDLVTDLCLPDDEEDTDLWACMVEDESVGEGHSKIEKERYGRACCEASGDRRWCEDMPTCAPGDEECGLKVTASPIEMPEGLTYQAGFLGAMKVVVEGGDRFSSLGLSRTLTRGQALFGEQCDGVPTGDEVDFHENSSASQFIAFLRTGTTGWSTAPTQKEVDTFEAYFQKVGAQNLRTFYGKASGEVCDGSGEVSYNLVWNVLTDEVLYVILYPYSE